MDNPFTEEEIRDLREILENIHDVALDEDCIASMLEYQGERVVVTKPENVKDVIREALDGVDSGYSDDAERGA